MTDIPHQANQTNQATVQLERSRRVARRTALVLGGIAAAVYLGFILMGALGQ